MALNLSRFHGVEWDDEDEPRSNLVHCRRPQHLGPYLRRVVHEVLSEAPAELKMTVRRAAFAVVGPDRSTSTLWVVLLDVSARRGDHLRPVTGWRAGPDEKRAWRYARQRGRTAAAWL
jgi:hypothetical protein